MRIPVMVAALLTETWFKGKKDQRDVPVLALMDADRTDPQMVVKQTFDYALSAEEAEKYDPEKLEGTKFHLWVSLIKFTDGGRMRVNGRIDPSTVRPEVLRGPNTTSQQDDKKTVANGSAVKVASSPLATAGGR